ncbi:HlyD family secretion protein [Falsiroseomonas sp.]|uniref:HlyD family secretion protein n=1 Tax=Falsiroseomonas sp. TaxID=2870721 RepID=UPI002722B2C6|nr:HlyD family secretion protein [Falsiroseomonas sp.]MDO9503519.1 HlyD family secretion protein [Falsiroseomonas sp.]
MLFIGIGGVFLQDRFFATGVRQAVLSGALVTVRTPIEGVLATNPDSEAGLILPMGARLGQVRNPRVDTARLDDLTRQRRLAEAEHETLIRRAVETAQAVSIATQRAEAFSVARREMLTARVLEMEANEAAAASRAQEASATLRRSTTLTASGVQARAALDTARRSAAVAEAELRAARDRRRSAQAERDAALSGVFASDPANDRSTSAQTEDRLRLLVADLAAQRDEFAARAAALRIQEQAEETRIALLREAQLTVPVQARVVRWLAQPGEQIRAGQDIVLLADCSQPEVTGGVEPRVLARLTPGAPVRFRAEGESQWRAGHVTALHAEAPAADGSGGRYQVVARLAPRSDGQLSCDAGRLGRLVFD